MNEQRASRYLKQVASIVALVALLLASYIEHGPMAFADRAYPLWIDRIEFARGQGNRTDTPVRGLLLGDSRVQAALIPSEIGPGVRSLALMSSTPIDAYYLLRDYLDAHEAPAWMLLSFAPYHLARGNERLFWNHSVKYGAHDFSDFREILDRSVAYEEPLLPGAGRARTSLEWLLYRLRFPPYYLAELKAAKLFARHAENAAAREAIRRGRGYYAFGTADGHSGIVKEARLERFAASPLLDRYLRDAIRLASDAGSHVLVRSMPLNESSHRALSPQYVSSYADYMNGLGSAYPEVDVDPRLRFLPDSHFGDGSHVNLRGARKLSASLRSELHSLGTDLARHFERRR